MTEIQMQMVINDLKLKIKELEKDAHTVTKKAMGEPVLTTREWNTIVCMLSRKKYGANEYREALIAKIKRQQHGDCHDTVQINKK